MEIMQALKVMEDLEVGLAAAYQHLSKHFAEDKEAAAFFYTLALEENSHADLVRLQKRTVRASLTAFNNEVQMDATEAARVMEAARYLGTSTVVTLKEALEKTYHMETSAAELYVITALQKTNRDLAEFLIQMGETFRTHYGYVNDFVHKRGIDIEALEKGQLRQVRVPYAADVTVNGAIKVRAVDLSEGGVFLLTGRSFKQGSLVQLDLPLGPVGPHLKLSAKVQFDQEGVGMGLMFTAITEPQRKALKAFIEGMLKSRAEEGIGLSKAKLLMVSSPKAEERNLRIYVNALIAGGFVVMDVKGFAEAAMVVTKDHDIRAVVVDVESQEEDNLKFVSFVRANPRHKNTPVLALTTSYSKELEARTVAAGAARLLHKMTTPPDKLLKAIKELTGL